jgi:DNA-directed RNA polymerase subunit E'/Rpb7
LFTEVGGLANEEHLAWIKHKHVRVGDEIRVKIVEAGSVERPVQKRRTHLAETLRAKKRYVRTMAKEVSWKIQARST